MPFTLAHVVAVYPFKKFTPKYLSVSGLVMGAMAPDFEYFVRATLYGVWGHTFWGVFFFDLPVSILCCVVFHGIVKRQFILHLPNFLFQRFSKYLTVDWVQYARSNPLRVLVSVFLGIFTHFLWDNFTHEPNYISPVYADFLLREIVFFGNQKPLYGIFQLASSAVGMAGFLWIIGRLEKRPERQIISASKKNYYWLCILTVMIAFVAIRYVLGVPDEKPKIQLLVILISSFLFALVVVSGYWQKQREHEN